jgi:CRISPR-associated endonuclease/helicase Cas3
LAISTLRGQFADNGEWRNDPTRPAVIVGTVDMIGSRLLFAGYGRGFKSRPLHAGFLGQDVLLVHDEAHLEPAFQELITAVESEQQRRGEFCGFRVMALTATGRDDAGRFQLTDADHNHGEVCKRIKARKGITFWPIDDEKEMVGRVVQSATKYKDSGQAVIVFLRRLEHVEKVTEELRKAKLAVQTLTGTLRGLERDALAKDDPIFARFMVKPPITPKPTPKPGTVYLVCTSAGEVGLDISADHLVCDLTPFDSMVQRLGRVNRLGVGDAQIDVVHTAPANGSGTTDVNSFATSVADDIEKTRVKSESTDPNDAVSNNELKTQAKPESPFDQACMKTLSLLQKLPKREDQRHDASPAALRDLPSSDRLAAFTPLPTILPASDILFDVWALTSVRQKMPGRPPVADWLHGVAEWEPSETHVAWREEVGYITGQLLETYIPEDLLEDYPLKPHELLRDTTDRVFKHMEKLAVQHADSPVWVMADDEPVLVTTMGKLVAGGKPLLNSRTVLLPPEVGGWKGGMLNGNAAFDNTQRQSYDISDRWQDPTNTLQRSRIWDDEEQPRGMRLVRTIDTHPDADEEQEQENQTSSRRYWLWYVRPRSADDDGSRAATRRQELKLHLELAERFAREIVAKLRLSEPEASAVALAARCHDIGKDRAVWQQSIRNQDYPRQVLAKSGGKIRPVDFGSFRHEFGSLLDVMSLPEFLEKKPDVQDLVLHMIAAHHGRARPHFPADEAFDPKHTDETAAEMAREVPRRFARLQRKYGRWGLAYLESLVRAADALASQADDILEAKPVKTNSAQIQEASR